MRRRIVQAYRTWPSKRDTAKNRITFTSRPGSRPTLRYCASLHYPSDNRSMSSYIYISAGFVGKLRGDGLSGLGMIPTSSAVISRTSSLTWMHRFMDALLH